MKAFMSWWLAVLGVSAAVFYAFYIGAAQHVFMGDGTRITWATAAIAVLISCVLGYACWRARELDPYENVVRQKLARYHEIGLFAEDGVMRLGMFGTTIGCILVFSAAFGSIDTSDPSKITALLGNVSSSLGIVLGTTAVGLASSLVLKVQNIILQHALDG